MIELMLPMDALLPLFLKILGEMSLLEVINFKSEIIILYQTHREVKYGMTAKLFNILESQF